VIVISRKIPARLYNAQKCYRELLRAPCKGTVFQRVRIPSGVCRSSRKQSEQPWR
jgi:hypothetical protein